VTAPSPRRTLAAWGVLAAVGGMSLAGLLLTPARPDRGQVLLGPSTHHLLGTDGLGRDLLARLVVGAPASVLPALVAVLVGAAVGVPWGCWVRGRGPRTQRFTQLVADAILTVPYIMLAALITLLWHQPRLPSMLALGAIFYRAAHAAHAGRREVRWRDRPVVRGLLAQVVRATGAAMLIVSSLGFLGVAAAGAPNWGGVLAGQLPDLAAQPWAVVFPAGLLLATAAALNTIAATITVPLGDVEGARPLGDLEGVQPSGDLEGQDGGVQFPAGLELQEHPPVAGLGESGVEAQLGSTAVAGDQLRRRV